MAEEWKPPENPRDVARKERELNLQLLKDAATELREVLDEVCDAEAGNEMPRPRCIEANCLLLDYGRQLKAVAVYEGQARRVPLPLGTIEASMRLTKPNHFGPPELQQLFRQILERFHYLRREPLSHAS